MPPKFLQTFSPDIILFMSLVSTYTLMRVRVRDNRNRSVSPLKDKFTGLPFPDVGMDISWFTSLFGKKTPSYLGIFPVMEKKLIIFTKIVRIALYLNNIKK